MNSLGSSLLIQHKIFDRLRNKLNKELEMKVRRSTYLLWDRLGWKVARPIRIAAETGKL